MNWGRLFIKRWGLRRLVCRTLEVKLILGSGPTSQPGWISTDIDCLDITSAADWRRLMGVRRASALMAEHVWEHLDERQTALANRCCWEYLAPGKSLRLAVPDGLHPSSDYIAHVRPGGTGPGAEDHKVLYDYRNMTARLESAGFAVRLLEYWDETGRFHFIDWNSDEGHIDRSRRYDERNRQGTLAYTSLIVDATKPTAA